MTTDEINRLLAEEVMGWTYYPEQVVGLCRLGAHYTVAPSPFSAIFEKDWNPTTDLNDADKVLHVILNGWRGCELGDAIIRVAYDRAECLVVIPENPSIFKGKASTLAEAICLAAVKVVKGEQP